MEGEGRTALSGALRDTMLGSKGTGISSSPITCWFKSKPCSGAASCQNWEVHISRGDQKGTHAATGQQRKAFPTLNLGALLLGSIK